MAPAFDEDGIVTSERWIACSSLTANGQVGELTPVLPPSGDKEALFTSGDVANAPGPNDDTAAGTNNGTELRGAFDVSILRLDLDVPAGTNCLSFELAFQSEEFPEYVNQGFNDGFLAELDTSDWSVAGEEITAPHNFALDSGGSIVSVNSSFFDAGRVITDTGSQYDGSTPRLTVRTPITPGAHSLYLSIFDAGDNALDSGAFVDRLQALTAPCAAGAGEDPVAVDDVLTTPEDTPASVNVLANDTDPDEDTLSITSKTNGAHGTVECAAASCTYTPEANFNGSDSFTYTVSDGKGGADTATVNVTVTPVNDDPNAVDDALTVAEDDSGSVNVLANDTDVDGNSLTVTSLTPNGGAWHGLLHGRGRVHATRRRRTTNGPDSLHLHDHRRQRRHATRPPSTCTVTPVNDDPTRSTTALDDVRRTRPRRSTCSPTTPTSTATRSRSPPRTSGAARNRLLHGCGRVHVHARRRLHRPRLLHLHGLGRARRHGHGHGRRHGDAVNDAAGRGRRHAHHRRGHARDGQRARQRHGSGRRHARGHRQDERRHTARSSCTAGGACTYTPDPDYNGPDSFTYTVSDGHGGSGHGHGRRHGHAGERRARGARRRAHHRRGHTPAGRTCSPTTATPRATASPLPGRRTARTGRSAAPAGTAPTRRPPTTTGPTRFTYTIGDGHGGTDTATVNITVTPVNDAPNAVDDTLTTGQGTAGSRNVLANDTDVDGDALERHGLHERRPRDGHLRRLPGAARTRPPPASRAPTSFTYTIDDGDGVTDTATVNVTVTPLAKNHPPSCANVHPTKTRLWPPNHTFRLVRLVGAKDVDGDTLRFKITKVTQDERVKRVAGRGDRAPDARRVWGHPNWIMLRAERDPYENGRVYRIHYTVFDGEGGKCSGVEKVRVPAGAAGPQSTRGGWSTRSAGERRDPLADPSPPSGRRRPLTKRRRPDERETAASPWPPSPPTPLACRLQPEQRRSKGQDPRETEDQG